MMDPKICNADLPALMPMLTPMVAAIGVYLALKYQRETMAKATFREFLKLCVQYPHWADGKPAEGEQDQYSWFVAHFLWAAEEILAYSPRTWKKNLQLHLRYHQAFLRNDVRFRRDDLPTYDRAGCEDYFAKPSEYLKRKNWCNTDKRKPQSLVVSPPRPIGGMMGNEDHQTRSHTGMREL